MGERESKNPKVYLRVGSRAQNAQCPRCKETVHTVVTRNPSLQAWLFAAIICVCGGCLGCFLVPLCLESCQDVTHNCPRCFTVIGVHKP